jgi:hypothetical protein
MLKYFQSILYSNHFQLRDQVHSRVHYHVHSVCPVVWPIRIHVFNLLKNSVNKKSICQM